MPHEVGGPLCGAIQLNVGNPIRELTARRQPKAVELLVIHRVSGLTGPRARRVLKRKLLMQHGARRLPRVYL